MDRRATKLKNQAQLPAYQNYQSKLEYIDLSNDFIFIGGRALFHTHGNLANVDDSKKLSFHVNLSLLSLAAMVLEQLFLLCDMVLLAFAFY